MMSSGSKANCQSRDWLLTVPMVHGDARREPSDVVEALKNAGFVAGVGQPEKGEKTGYEHMQLFCQCKSRRRFSTVKRALSDAGLGDVHVEPRKGSVGQAVEYVTKEDTRAGGCIEWGVIARGKRATGGSRQGRRSDLDSLRDLALSGMSVEDILRSPYGASAAHVLPWLRTLVESAAAEAARSRIRDVHVTVLVGPTGTGKTRYCIDREGLQDLFICGDYRHPFDGYRGEPAILLDEFSGQLPIEQVLRLLDDYPYPLPCRYQDRWAAFERVYICSNVHPRHWWMYAQTEQLKAFARRVDQWKKGEWLFGFEDVAPLL